MRFSLIYYISYANVGKTANVIEVKVSLTTRMKGFVKTAFEKMGVLPEPPKPPSENPFEDYKGVYAAHYVGEKGRPIVYFFRGPDIDTPDSERHFELKLVFSTQQSAENLKRVVDALSTEFSLSKMADIFTTPSYFCVAPELDYSLGVEFWGPHRVSVIDISLENTILGPGVIPLPGWREHDPDSFKKLEALETAVGGFMEDNRSNALNPNVDASPSPHDNEMPKVHL